MNNNQKDADYISEGGLSEGGSIKGYRVWPFCADRLFYTLDEDSLAEATTSYRMHGIFSYNHACGFVYDYADKVYNATKRCVSAVIIQDGESNTLQPANGNRIDLELLKHVAGSALPYRLCTRNDCICNQIEDEVAKAILHSDNSIISDLAFRIQNVLRKHKSSSTEDDCSDNVCTYDYVETCEIKGHSYYRYNCPYSLVGGVMMPIVVNDVTIAVAIVGQFCWNSAHASKIASLRGGKLEEIEAAYNPAYNETIIKLLYDEVHSLENSLERRLDRNASGFFSAVVHRIHTILSGEQQYTIKGTTNSIENVIDYLKKKLSFSQALFFPRDELYREEGKTANPIGKASTIKKNVKPSRKDDLNSIVAKSDSDTVYLTKDATLFYSLHLFDDKGNEACRLAFHQKNKPNNDKFSTVEWVILCNSMVTILRELHMQWTLALREEEHEQFILTMRQFTHELGQKSFSGTFCTSQLHEQIYTFETRLNNSRSPSVAHSNIVSKGVELIARTADDLESIFDGIAYLSQLARAKAGGLKYNPHYFDVRYAILNSLAAQYRIDIRGRGMNLIYDDSYNKNHIVYGDKDLVNIAVHNLVSNAVKYGYPGTMAYYKCYEDYDEKGRRGTFIDVIDYGILIPEEERETIFEDGTHLGEARNDSMGFGLFLTKKIMEMHKGFCRVKSSEIVSKYSLPYIKEMLANKDSIPSDIKIDMNDVAVELSRAKVSSPFRDSLYDRSVHSTIKVSPDAEPVITRRTLFYEGQRPMAKTVMQLFFPEEDGYEKDNDD